MGLSVRDRGGGQFGEVRDTVLGVHRHGFSPCRGDSDQAPHTAAHDNGDTDDRAETQFLRDGCRLPGDGRRVVDARRLAGLQHQRRDVMASGENPVPDLEVPGRVAP